jgi:hypothetical protein
MSSQTGKCPPGSFGTNESHHVQNEKIEKWFLGPLRSMSKMKGDQAFIAMMVCLVLYEKYLRVAKEIGDEKFCQGSKAFRIMSEDFDFPPDDCYRFWQDWRNGLLHRAMPSIGHYDGYVLSGDKYPKPLQIDGKRLKIDPWKFCAIVIRLVDRERTMWKDPKNPLAKIMESTEEE